MGGNVSREISINEEEGGNNIPRSATLPVGLKGLGEKFNWSGTLPRGLGLDTSFTVKLTKSKKLDDESSKTDLDETKVEIVKRCEEEGKEEKEEKDEEETMKDFIEAMLITVMEDALANIGNSKMKKSSTLPAGFRGLSKSHSFGKRIRQSIRKLVPAKKIVEENSEEANEEDKEPVEDLTKLSEKDETILDNTETNNEAENTLNNTKNRTLPISVKSFDLQSKKKQIQISLKKLVQRKKKPSKASLELVNSIIDEIIKDVEGEEQLQEEQEKDKVEEAQEKVEEIQEKVENTEEETLAETPEAEAKEEESAESNEAETEASTGVLDKSND